jgi:hypothetical protein
VIRASAGNLPSAEIRIHTVDVTGVKGVEPEHFYEMTKETDHTDKITEPVLYGTANVASGRPSFPSSNNEDRTLAADGDHSTSWIADIAGSGQYWMCDLEFVQYLYKLKFTFDNEPYPFEVEVSMDKDAEGIYTEEEVVITLTYELYTDKAELQAAVNGAVKEKDCIPGTYDAYAAALKDAKALLADDKATQEAVDAALAELTKAFIYHSIIIITFVSHKLMV